MKPLNLNDKASKALKQYPELIDIVADMGFPQVRNPILRGMFAGRFTLNEAIEQSGLDRVDVINTLVENGFSIQE